MSKLIETYNVLKNEDSETLYLFKSGIFFIALLEDAKILERKFGFKLTNLNEKTVKCGFPTASLEKYSKLFINNGLKFKIIENHKKYSPSDYLLNENANTILEKINKVDIDNLSVSEAYSFIENLKKLSQQIKT